MRELVPVVLDSVVQVSCLCVGAQHTCGNLPIDMRVTACRLEPPTATISDEGLASASAPDNNRGPPTAIKLPAPTND